MLHLSVPIICKSTNGVEEFVITVSFPQVPSSISERIAIKLEAEYEGYWDSEKFLNQVEHSIKVYMTSTH